jgi:hypothetical protein
MDGALLVVVLVGANDVGAGVVVAGVGAGVVAVGVGAGVVGAGVVAAATDGGSVNPGIEVGWLGGGDVELLVSVGLLVDVVVVVVAGVGAGVVLFTDDVTPGVGAVVGVAVVVTLFVPETEGVGAVVDVTLLLFSLSLSSSLVSGVAVGDGTFVLLLLLLFAVGAAVVVGLDVVVVTLLLVATVVGGTVEMISFGAKVVGAGVVTPCLGVGDEVKADTVVVGVLVDTPGKEVTRLLLGIPVGVEDATTLTVEGAEV